MKLLRTLGMMASLLGGALLGVAIAVCAVYFAILYALGLPFKDWRFFY